MNTSVKTFFFMLFLGPILFLCASCKPKQHYAASYATNKNAVPLFIKMPANTLVFENISHLLHTTLVYHFKRVGYPLAQQAHDGYTLALSIKALTPTQKYVSPDVLLFHARLKLELTCELYNFNNLLIKQKTFCFSTLISKPINPILNSSFLDFEYKKLFERAAPKIEQYIRPLLIDTQ